MLELCYNVLVNAMHMLTWVVQSCGAGRLNLHATYIYTALSGKTCRNKITLQHASAKVLQCAAWGVESVDDR